MLSAQRLMRFVKKRGLTALPGTVITNTWRALFGKAHLCFSLTSESFRKTLIIPGLTVEKCDSEADIGDTRLQEVLAEEGEEYLAQIRQNFATGAVFWLGLIDNRVVAYQWTRRGSKTKRYLVNILPQDIVIYATATFPQWRGKGIYPAMMQYIIEKELAGHGTAYVNCKVWNKPSIRGIIKAGFTQIGQYTHEIDITPPEMAENR